MIRLIISAATCLLSTWLLAMAALAAEDTLPTSSQHVDASAVDSPTREACILSATNDAPEDTTVKQLRAWCGDNAANHIDRHEHALRARLALEKFTQYNPFVITPHYRNYILPYSYWSHPRWNDPLRDNGTLDRQEAKFQLSIKTPLLDDFWDGSTLYGAFTSIAYWQVFNTSISKPFRETNYQPELFVAKPINFQIGPIDSELFAVGYMHQSNGHDIPLSRSWERLFLNYVFRIGSYYYSIKPWWRLPERKRRGPTDRGGDDNPDIEHYLGHFELHIARPFGNHVAEIMLRNNLRSDNKGAAMADYSFPLSKRFKGLLQIFTGYGDSLINYNNYETRYSIGILLTDTL